MVHENFSEKLKFFLKANKISQRKVAAETDSTPPRVNNLINGRDRFGLKSANLWGELYGLDPLWLMTQGEQGTAPTDEAPAPITVNTHDDVIKVPVINLDVRGGYLYNTEADTMQFASGTMPFSRSIATEGDVVVPVVGDSMQPRYPDGSHVLIRPLPMWREWLELGQSYVLELADYRRTIKIVRKGSTPDTYRLECYNERFDTTEIPKSLIQHVWQVLMCIKREAM